MTDFRKPTTPGEALRAAAQEMLGRERGLRDDAATKFARAEELLLARLDVEAFATYYDQFQLAPESEEIA